ncbi:FUSC family protein [Flavobacterium psychrotolerans]|uniref:FUSC family protein n=1 Tax=Flavobacterium psychrotolerans TaxID=2169410 RepID=A0A2U1JLT4_9FLAO|nr:FUSC family membrane protein [Flavobacterium psychrotolerans]PWA06131.1 FUSC family protein [Flavobacterium psychrotolerans]
MIRHIKKFTDSTNFTNALKVTIAAVVPVLVFSYFGNFQIGFTIALGAFLTYPSDIPSNLKHKINGVLVAALMIASANLLINLLYPIPYIFYPFLALLLFFSSLISVYGQRATMVSFSVLLSISLSFAHLHTGIEVMKHSGLILFGGLFYLLIALVSHYIRPYRYVELQIAECIKLTSKYLKLRGDLWNIDADRKTIIEKQLHLQVELNIIHENLREIIIRNHSSSGSSNQNRKMLIVFISLLDILELALSTSFDHSKLHEKFNMNPKVLVTYQNLAYNLAKTLKFLSKSLESKTKYVSQHSLFQDLEALENGILEYEKELGKKAASEGVLMLSNMHHYAEKQVEKIKIVERAFRLAVKPKDLKGAEKDLEKFLTPQYYPLSTLLENLSFHSTLFRHSLRLTLTILIGFLIGKILPFQNVYWILLTIVVIMRPGYGLTKQRSFERIFGTIVGGLIAFGILSFVHNEFFTSLFAILSMLLGFSFTKVNYKIGATFVTMYVVFIYGMLTPNIEDVIQYRILDTLVGAALAFAANYFLWPSWEFLNIRLFLKKSIKANRNYLKEISVFYNKKGEVTTSYKLSRKQAFIEIGNLMTSFQRMTQEPKSKQKQLPLIYKLVELNHTLLTASASLGTYVKTHQTTKASEAFNVVVDSVIKKLNYAIEMLQSKDGDILIYETQKTDLNLRFTELKNIRARELKESGTLNESEFQSKIEEAQLVIEQLIWLTSLSENIVKEIENLNKS